MRKIGKGLAVLLAGALAAFAPAAAAQATGDKTKPTPRAELTSSAACTQAGWRASFVLRNNAQQSFIEIVKVTGAVTALDPAAVAPGGTATASAEMSKQARFTGIEVEYKFVDPAPAPSSSSEAKTMTGTHPPKTLKLKTHVKRCACPWTPPTDNPSTPPSGGPSTPPSEEPSDPPTDPPSEDPDPSEEPSSPPSSNPPSDDPTSPPDDEPSLPPTEEVGNKLPLTGAPVAGLAVIAGVLIAGGGAALIVLRRRRERFEA